MVPEIEILNGSSLRDRELDGMRPRIQEIFGATVRVRPAGLNLRAAYDSSRKQTNSTALLVQILNRSAAPSRKSIAIVEVDLFIPILTFVFGEAQLGGPAAIVSAHRLCNGFYGLPNDKAVMIDRLEKEIIHELGHTFGLYHCHQFECVMRSSTYVEEIDMKRASPCGDCALLLAGDDRDQVPDSRSG